MSDSDTAPQIAPCAVALWRPGPFTDLPELPVIEVGDVRPVLPELDLWDCWPLQHEDGRTVRRGGREWWFFLSAPQLPDPAARHDQARIRLLSTDGREWCDHGPVLTKDATPGTREWAGSAVLMDDGHSVALFFTAVGRKDEPFSFEQRIFRVAGVLGPSGPTGWQVPSELVQSDGIRYFRGTQREGRPGQIKGFRDPAWFRDSHTGDCHLLFTASAAGSPHSHDGLIGIATLLDGQWTIRDPLVDAVGVNNELERPHIVVRAGLYYLFWSTQRSVFANHQIAGPTGLYAMVAPALSGPWRPVNGTGLVACTPQAEPMQSFSWWVTGEDEVWSFIDHWGLSGRSIAKDPDLSRSMFGGCPAPVFRLKFAGELVVTA